MCCRLLIPALGTALYLLSVATPLAAQTMSTSALHGVVRDTTGAVMVSVEVVLTDIDERERRTTMTDAQGAFSFDRLSKSVYVVTASAAGFADARRQVAVSAAATAPIELIMAVVVAEHVEVTADLGASGSSGLAATTLTGAAIEALPDDPGALLQRIRELAGATGGDGQVSITIDGFDPSLRMPPKQAIQAIRISSNWFAPEFAQPGHARIDIITKPGASAVHGDLRLNVNHSALNARNALARDDDAGSARDITGYLSGPLIPQRWSFALYGGEWLDRQDTVVRATVLRGGQPSQHVASVPTSRTVGNIWLGTSYQLAPLHTLAASFSQTRERASNLGLDSGLDLPERAYGRTGTDAAARITLTSVPSPRVLNELRVQLNPRRSVTEAATRAPALIVLEAFHAGGNQDALFSAAGRAETTVVDAVTLFATGHTMKAGVEARTASHEFTDTANFGGTFLFGAAVDDATGAPISPLENYRRTLAGRDGYGPSQFWISAGDPQVTFRERSIGAFAQDDWAVSPQLTVSYGLRSEWQSAASDADLGARAGVSIALDEARKNVIRAGTGSFYRRIEPQIPLDAARLDGVHQQQFFVDRPGFFATVPAVLADAAALRRTIRVVDEDLRAPHVLMSAASYDRELQRGMFLTLKYGVQHGTRLLRTTVDSRPDAQSARILRYESTGRLLRHELTSGWRWNAGAHAALFANYSYVQGKSDTDGHETAPADSSRLDQEYGAAAGDRTHYTNLGAQFTLPGGLFVTPYLTAASGDVFNITTGFDNNGDGVFTDRPAVVAPGTPGALQTRHGWLVARHPDGAPILARNAGRDPATVRVDLRISRAFRPARSAGFVVAASVDNLLNAANLLQTNGVVTSPSFGELRRAGTPRRVSLSTGFNF